VVDGTDRGGTREFAGEKVGRILGACNRFVPRRKNERPARKNGREQAENVHDGRMQKRISRMPLLIGGEIENACRRRVSVKTINSKGRWGALSAKKCPALRPASIMRPGRGGEETQKRTKSRGGH